MFQNDERKQFSSEFTFPDWNTNLNPQSKIICLNKKKLSTLWRINSKEEDEIYQLTIIVTLDSTKIYVIFTT